MASQGRVKQISQKKFKGLGGPEQSGWGSRMSFQRSGTGENTVYTDDQLLILHLLMYSFCEEKP